MALLQFGAVRDRPACYFAPDRRAVLVAGNVTFDDEWSGVTAKPNLRIDVRAVSDAGVIAGLTTIARDAAEEYRVDPSAGDPPEFLGGAYWLPRAHAFIVIVMRGIDMPESDYAEDPVVFPAP